MIEIPIRLRNMNFVLLGGVDGKAPFEKAWQKKNHFFGDPVLQDHLARGKNYGVQSNNSSVESDKGTNFLVVLDFDKREIQDKLLPLLPETFTTTSGSPKQCYHLWFACDNNKSFKIKNEKGEALIDVIGAGNQIVAPGSKHQSGSTYSIVKDIPFAFIPYAEIQALLTPYDRQPKKPKKKEQLPQIKSFNNSVAEEIYSSVSMEEVLKELGVDVSKNPTNCPLDLVEGERCMGWNENTAHCFGHDRAWNKFSLIRECKNLTNKETYEWFAQRVGRLDELKKERKSFAKQNNPVEKFAEDITTQKPIFYDKAKNFWVWDVEKCRWIISDDVDVLNILKQENPVLDIIDSKARQEIINSFKQSGRLNTPQPIQLSWVQSKDKIYDVKTGKEFKATPQHFVKNPIPWKIGESKDTPIIDKLFSEWVEPKYVPTLYQILAYSLCPDRFMQRIIAFVGGGSNGKGTFVKLLYKFLGEDNCVSSELKLMSENQFETATIFGKLLVVFGEVSYDDLRNTNVLKQMAGEDKIRYCFKGKTPFSDKNTALGICLTNSLPTTPDKSIGFYRKWLVVDFPNQFKDIKTNPIDLIPEQEFENLMGKCLDILKELYENPSFTNEGNFEERITRYEERSNPVAKFLEQNYVEEPGNFMALRTFTNHCNEWLKERHLRTLTAIQIGKILRQEGFLVGQRKIDGITTSSILNLKPLEPLEPSQIQVHIPRRTIENYDGLNGLTDGNEPDFSSLGEGLDE